jgi:hypothetical protein
MTFSIDRFIEDAARVSGMPRARMGGFDLTPGWNFFRDVATPIGHGLGILPQNLSYTGIDLAPIAQAAASVVSFVPGVGTVVSAAIDAGVALASGRPIDQALVAAVKGAIPGGDIAAAGFDLGKAAITGQNIGQAVIGAVGEAAGIEIPDAAKAALSGGLNAAQAIANGKSPDKALIGAAMQAIPGDAQNIVKDALGSSDVKKIADTLTSAGQTLIPNLNDDQRNKLRDAIHIGVATQHAVNKQVGMNRSITRGGVPNRLRVLGHNSQDSIARAARASLRGVGVHGFDLGIGVMQNKASVFRIHNLRNRLSPADQHGFDVALALHKGRAISKPLPPSAPPAAKASHAIVHGMRGSAAEHKAAMMRTAIASPTGRAGAVAAAKEIQQAPNAPTNTPHEELGFFAWIWHAFKSLVGLEKEAKEAFFKAGDELAKKDTAPAVRQPMNLR